MKTFIQTFMFLGLGLSLIFAEMPGLDQGSPATTAQAVRDSSQPAAQALSERVVRGILVSRPYSSVVIYQGYLVDKRPVYRGILISPGAVYSSTRSYYEEPDSDFADGLITLGIVGGLTALILSTDGHCGWGWHHRGGGWNHWGHR